MIVRLLGPRDEPVTIVLLNGDSINCHLNLDYSTHRLMQRSDFIRELYSVVNAKTHTGQRAECVSGVFSHIWNTRITHRPQDFRSGKTTRQR